MNFKYNTQKEKLIISEYGRNVQDMINEIKNITDQEKRQAYAEEIIKLMGNLNPANKGNVDAEKRLWNHMFRLAGFDLEVLPPGGEKPTPESTKISPQKPSYGQSKMKFRHYGRYIQQLVDKAAEETDKEKQIEILNIIGSYMKLAYKTWNPEHYVSDDIILDDLGSLCEGKIELDESITFDALDSSKTYRRQRSANPPVRSKSRNGRKRKSGRKRR
jgi:hypothetical protein